MKKLSIVLLAVVFITGIAALSQASSGSELYDAFKHPAPGFTTYGDIRLRQKYGWKMTDLRDSHDNFGRYRARIGQKIEATDDVTFDVRLMWEFRAYRRGNAPKSVDFDYAMLDRFNVSIENMFDAPLTGTFGRQDIMINPWLIFDGVPFTGSTMVFFDAARLTFDFDEADSKLDLIYIDNRANPKARLRPIGRSNFVLSEQDEHGAIIYLTNKSLQDTTLEGYFIYKNNRSLDNLAGLRPGLFPGWSRKSEIFTFGGAMSQNLDTNWSYRVEAAIQTGDKETNYKSGDMRDLRAWGTNNRLTYNFRDERNSAISFDYEFLSGDDGSDSKDKAFDPLWGQWPRFSELYIYTYSREASIAEVTNLHRAALSYNFDPVEKMNFRSSYQLLWADHSGISDRAPGDAFAGSSSLFRGHLITSQLSYRFTKDLSGRLNAEYFVPGNYYGPDHRRNATFLRAEVVYSF